MTTILQPTFSHRYQLIVDTYEIISLQNTKIDIDICNDIISMWIRHPTDPEGATLIEELSILSKQGGTISIKLIDGNGNQVGMISKKCKMIRHSMPLDYSSNKRVTHEVEFKILG